MTVWAPPPARPLWASPIDPQPRTTAARSAVFRMGAHYPWRAQGLQPPHLSSIVIARGQAPEGLGVARIIAVRSRGVRGPVTTTSFRFQSHARLAILAALLGALGASACSSGAAAPRPQPLTLASGIAADFTNDLIRRFNRSLPQTQVSLQTSAGG